MLLVTGGAGFIGSHLVAAALAQGHRVRVLDDLSSGRAERLPAEAELVVGDITDAVAVKEAMQGVTSVAHLAALRAVPRSVSQPLDTDRVNSHGTLCVLEAAKQAGVRRVVVTSSSSVYGAAATLPTPETARPAPASPYAVSKLAGEHYAEVYADLFGLSTLSLRLFNVYGPGQSPDGPYAQLVPRTLDALRNGARPVVYGDGTQSRDLVYVGDVTGAFLAGLDSDATGILNVGSGRATTVLDVVKAAGGTDVQFLPARAGDVPHTCADVTRIGEVLGWQPTVDLAEGLRRTA
ncbi:MAG TPA: NAD-dependent epimerase/dehydratase family protein [Acidimicrobiales bacterium]|nr:NAD-dependent epimerase/dehydratase family protein [Acidimicrobiales bacterium]